MNHGNMFDPDTTANVLADVMEERERQVKDLGYDDAHDDGHLLETLATLGRNYLQRARQEAAQWPSGPDLTEVRENLVKAAALTVAAIERLDREVSRG